METIKEAKEYIRANFEKGSNCPCCGQNVKLYKRKLNVIMARMLIRLSKMPPGFLHVKHIVKGISYTGTNNFSMLVYWGLIEEEENEDKEKRTSGNWKITDKGIEFVNNRISVKSHALVFDAKLRGFSEGTTTITEALGKKFNYYELMND